MKDKVALEGFQTLFTIKERKCQCRSPQGKNFVSSFPENDAKILSLYFKALKYTVKTSEKTKGAKNRKRLIKR